MVQKNKILVLLIGLFLAVNLQASLSTADRDSLMKHLKILSDQGWVEESKNLCNNIMGNSNYSWQEWQEFFEDYYEKHPATQNLWGYLGYPTCYWFSDDLHYNLQRAHIEIFPNKIDSIFTKYDVYLATSLGSEEDLRKSLFV